MALIINTDSLKTVSSMTIECQLANQLGLQIFNNIGTQTAEYAELCANLRESCDKIIDDAEKIKSLIPLVR